MEFLLGRAEIGVDGEERDAFAAALERRLDEEVEQCSLVASGAPRHEEAAAAGRGEDRLGNKSHKGAGERGIEGIAAVFENFRGGRDGQLMPRRNHALWSLPSARLRRSCKAGQAPDERHSRRKPESRNGRALRWKSGYRLTPV